MDKIITKIEVGKRNKERVNVFVNEEFAFACSADLVYYYKLTKGKKIDLNMLESIVEEDNYLKGKNCALKIIEKSYKTQDEVYKKLSTKGYSDKIINRIMSFLQEYDFVNDDKYVDMFIREKIYSCGKNKIKYLLIKKGVNEEIIKNKLHGIDSSLEKQIALKLAQKKSKTLIKSGENYNKIYKKIGDYLVNRGYNFDLIKSVLNEILKSEENNFTSEGCENEYSEDVNLDELKRTAQKRYSVLCKSESDSIKLYRKLGQYLIRRGYRWEDIKKTLKEIIKDE